MVLSPTEFIERLAAQVPPPRRHMVTYHGVLAPAAGYRDQVVSEDRPYRDAVLRHRKKPPASAAADGAEPDLPAKLRRRPTLWAELLRRTFGVDALHCPLCGGRRELIALITQPHTAQRILGAMGLPAEPPALAPARPPPQPRLPFVG